MSKRNVYHVKADKKSGQWIGKQVGEPMPVAVTSTKEECIELTVAEAKKNKPSQVRIHKLDGTLQKEYTYDNDPRNIKG